MSDYRNRSNKKTKKSRTSLYKTLSEGGNPYLKNANELLFSMGMHLSVVPNKNPGHHRH